MILLVERWDDNARRLAYSLAAAEYEVQTVVIQYDGFCDDEVVSPYEFFIYGGSIPQERSPLYFDKLELSDYWELQSTNSGGEIYDYEQLRAKLFYAEPKDRRYIRIIDWMDKEGRVCCSDHYNRFGHRFAQTVLNNQQKTVHKTYYHPDGTEALTENLLTGDIILTEDGKNVFFHSKSDFVIYYLLCAGLNVDRILYNSLSVPFFVAGKYCSQVNHLAHNVLFWQEPIAEEIPGNMRSILENNTAGTDVIAVQRKDAFEKIRTFDVDQKRFYSLGFIYPELRENTAGSDALIFTNSDQIEKLNELVQELPEIHFHIGAITEMSPKLLQMTAYSNVSLYPTITEKQIEALWKKCDLYLDINLGSEILSSVETAFKNKALIFAFENTAHNRYFVAEKNLFRPESYQNMAAALRHAVAAQRGMEDELKIQWNAANAASPQDYRRVIDGELDFE
ncbi:MAG: accessory Sec system glycosylation chaperone GtfB [Lachnospiraceae bacterium]|nr:accessory Sec system glycosylation chaperone GtfB [Lachnospiraceae bacterium]